MLPPLHAGLPQVTTRVGIDLHPIQADDPQATRWLRALVWPEHPERATVLQQVLALAQHEPPTLVAGMPSPSSLRPLQRRRRTQPCAVPYRHAGPLPARGAGTLSGADPGSPRQRDLFWLSSEGVGLGERRKRVEFVTILTAFQRGSRVERQLAYNHQHGVWLEWLDNGDNA